jgi:hypothetical protein
MINKYGSVIVTKDKVVIDYFTFSYSSELSISEIEAEKREDEIKALKHAVDVLLRGIAEVEKESQ